MSKLTKDEIYKVPSKMEPEAPVSTAQLKDLVYYLEGIYMGKGNLLPLGKIHIENLWKAIKHLQNEGL